MGIKFEVYNRGNSATVAGGVAMLQGCVLR